MKNYKIIIVCVLCMFLAFNVNAKILSVQEAIEYANKTSISHFKQSHMISPMLLNSRSNVTYLLTEVMNHIFLKEDKINEDILYKEIFETLPSNVYHIYRLLNDINNSNIYYLYGCKKYNNAFKDDDSYIFLKYDLNNNTKQQYKVIHQSSCLDGGTTDLRLMDDKEQMHYYHWDSKLKKAEDRHNIFDDITLIDVNLTEKIIEKFNKINDKIILE